MSIYAIIVGHWSAFQASRAEESVMDNPDNSLSWGHDAPTSRPNHDPNSIEDRDWPTLYEAICGAPKAPPRPPNPETGPTPSLPLQGPPGAPRNDEMAHRIYYQGIVYRVCNLLELVKEDASRVYCGTVDYPTVEVEVKLSLALKELVTLRRKLREQ